MRAESPSPSSQTTSSVLEAAIQYTREGLSVLPIPSRSKAPVIDGWQKLRLKEAGLPDCFPSPDLNIGVLLGEPSGNLVDLDLDCLEAVRLAPSILPPTGRKFGRDGNPNSHWLYVCDPPVPTTKRFQDAAVGPAAVTAAPKGKSGSVTLLEVRSTGAQTVFPPSVHETGEPIRFSDTGPPARVSGRVLLESASLLAAAVLLVRRWTPGRRHDLAMALAGALARNRGWSVDVAAGFIGKVATAADDEEVGNRTRAARDTFRAVEEGAPTTGWTRLVGLIGVEAANRVRGWIGDGRPAGHSPPLTAFAAGGGRTDPSWSEPRPLPGNLPPVPPFDFGLLPDRFRPWIQDIAERIQCPPDFPAVGAMAALAGVVGRKLGIRPKQRDTDWVVVPNLFCAVVGRPGIMKTPALQATLKPLKRLEVKGEQDFEDLVREQAAAQALAEAKKSGAKKQIQAAVDRGDPDAEALARELLSGAEPPPVRRRYLVNDPTVEKLGEILRDNRNGVTLYRDELVGFLKVLDRTGNEGARAFYLEAWNGTGRFSFDRIGRGTVDIPAVCLSLVGGIQPGPLAQYIRAAAAAEGSADDGLLQRFQLMVWPDVSRDWRNVDRWPDTAAKAAAYEVFDRLDRLAPGDVGAAPAGGGEGDPGEVPCLGFSPAAQAAFDEWRAGLERKVRSGEEHPAVESHLAKYRKLIPALALLIHLADDGTGPVGDAALEKAIRWGDYLEGHARRVYSPAVKPETGAALALVQRIRSGDVQDMFALRDVYRHCWSCLSRREDVEPAVTLLIDLGWLREVQCVETGGRDATRFLVHPRLLSQGPGGEPPEPTKAPSVSFDSASGGDIPATDGNVAPNSSTPPSADPNAWEQL